MFDFPSSPTTNDTHVTNGQTYRWNGTVWNWEGAPIATAERRNRIVNSAMQVSQEVGNTESAAAISLIYFCADQWRIMWNFNAGPTASAKRDTATLAPSGAASISTTIVTTGTPTAVAAGYYSFSHKIEGSRVADFMWGTASAKQVVLRFQFWSSAAGTFTLVIKNAAKTRSYVKPVVVTVPSTWKLYEYVIPGDTTGVWPVDTGEGMQITISPWAGTTFTTSTEGWQAGEMFILTGNYDAPGLGGTFKLGDVGLYLDPLNTGIAPLFEVPRLEDDFTECARYFWKGAPPVSERFSMNSYVAAGIMSWTIPWPVTMRIVPTVTSDFTGITLTNLATPIVGGAVTTENGTRLYTTCTAASTNSGFLMAAPPNHITASARM